MLTSDLDSDEEKDKGALDALLTAIIKELDLAGKVCLNFNNILILILKKKKIMKMYKCIIHLNVPEVKVH